MITARYFSSGPSDSTSRWTPCPPDQPSSSLRPARNYPRFRIWRPSSGRQRDFNPPEQRAAQHTLRHSPTSPARSCPQFGLGPSRTGLAHLAKTCWRSPGSRACCFSACAGSQTTQDRTIHSRLAWLSCCLPPFGTESASFSIGFSKPNSPAHRYLCLRFKRHLATSPARLEARMDSLLSFPVGLFHPLQHAGLSRRSPSGRSTRDLVSHFPGAHSLFLATYQ